MKRLHEFRGKGLIEGEWLYGDLFHSGDSVYIANDESDSIIMVDPDTVGQYTGRKDSDGTRIFEDDIVELGKHRGLVRWMSGKCCFQVSPGGVFITGQCKVLGNMFDHPELLED